MDQPDQALAYAEADFSAPHDALVKKFSDCFPGLRLTGKVLDLGCGPADFTLRMAKAHPGATFDGIDASQPMLELGAAQIQQAGLSPHIKLQRLRLPSSRLAKNHYQAAISNSLLHHLHRPKVLWAAIASSLAAGGVIFIADLFRPANREQAKNLVQRYAGDEPEILQRDFYHSLLAAFRPQEVRQQLTDAGLQHLKIEVTSDRHMIIFGSRENLS